jgi:predicted ATPase
LDIARNENPQQRPQVQQQQQPELSDEAKAKAIATLEEQVMRAQLQVDAAIAERNSFGAGTLGSAQLVMKRYPVSFLAILIAVILPWLTLLTTGKAPVHLALSGALAFKATPQSSLDTVEKKHAALIFSARAKENSAFSQALLLLFAGILTAFSGVYFFYSMTATKPDSPQYVIAPAGATDADKAALEAAAAARSTTSNTPVSSVAKVIAEDLFTVLPRIGILVFIEIIALFFLKQYQAMREEYRYFEAIRRSREDAALLLSYIEEKKIKIGIDKLMNHGVFISSAGVLKSGETTALVEERKISKDEMNVIADIVKTGINQIRAK